MKKMAWACLLSVAFFMAKGKNTMFLPPAIYCSDECDKSISCALEVKDYLSSTGIFESGLYLSSRQLVLGNILLKDINNKSLAFSEIISESPLVVLSFWASWCKPCMEEMNAINDKIDLWKEKAEFIFVAVSVDDARSGTKVKSLVNGKGWGFTVLKDSNQELKRYFGINNIPCTLILKNGKEVVRHSGYTPGGEDQLFRTIIKYND